MGKDFAQVRVESEAETIRSVAIISSIAYSLANFRGPLIRTMVDAGLRVYAMAPDHDEKTRAAVRQFGAEAVDFSLDRTGMHPVRDAIDTIRLMWQLRRLKPDLAFNYFIKPVIFGSVAAKLAGVRHRYAMVAGLGYVYTSDSSGLTLKRRALRAGVSTLYRLAFKLCRRVFFQNDDDVREFVSAGLIDPERIRRINGTGVDLDRWQPAPPVPSPPTFLLMARLLREKGIFEYVEAARAVRMLHPEARFILLGATDPNPGGLSRKQVEAWHAEGVVEWHGHVDDVRPWIAASGVYVLPSYREGKPRSTQEAMAMARPIITTDAPGCRDTVDDGVNGFLVPVGDCDALAGAMLRFVDDPLLVGRMGAESRRLAEERFDIRVINEVLLGEMGIVVSTAGCLASRPAG
ncbi:MAG TPA: glycosyltransferase family 4 protein [Sphingomicrobium sp.]|nr:glycosyltransferase family 4 protein [Sphingomicrobium sp.]